MKATRKHVFVRCCIREPKGGRQNVVELDTGQPQKCWLVFFREVVGMLQ